MIKTINVTWRDIKRGVPSNCTCCPIALAIRRHTKVDFSVARDIVYFRVWERVKLPSVAANFVIAFDQGDTVSPFKFKLDIPQ